MKSNAGHELGVSADASRSAPRWLIGVGSGAAAMSLVAACTSSGSHSAARSTSSASASDKTSSAAAGPANRPAAIPLVVANDVAARKSVSLTSCSGGSSAAEAKGTAKNAGTKTLHYAITVFFTNSHATVLGFAKTTVDAKPGQSASWTVSDPRVAGKQVAASGVRCVLRGVTTQ